MKKKTIIKLLALALVAAAGLVILPNADAGVRVGISIPFPGIVIDGWPQLVMVPGTYAYVVPDTDVVYYQGAWYRPYGSSWYIAAGWRGPWTVIAMDHIPGVVLSIGGHHRSAPFVREHVPRHHESTIWEREYFSDRRDNSRFDGDNHDRWDDGRGRDRGRGSDRDDDGRGRGRGRR